VTPGTRTASAGCFAEYDRLVSTGETPSLPGALWYARLVFVSMGMLLLLAHFVGFMTPAPEASASSESGGGVAELLVWLAPIAMLVLGLQLRGGSTAVRVLLAFVVVFLVSGSVLFAAQDFVFSEFGGGLGLMAVFVGLVAMPLLYVAVVLLFLPSSNAYAREIRQLAALDGRQQ
jgi:hypothetical protein